MRRQILLVAAMALAGLVLGAPLAGAGQPLAAGCLVTVLGDSPNPDEPTWIQIAASVFAGLHDVEQHAVTCWLQTAPTFGSAEISNTRHTCSGPGNAGACHDPTAFAVYPADYDVAIHVCVDVVWDDDDGHHEARYDADHNASNGAQCSPLERASQVNQDGRARAQFVGIGTFGGPG